METLAPTYGPDWSATLLLPRALRPPTAASYDLLLVLLLPPPPLLGCWLRSPPPPSVAAAAGYDLLLLRPPPPPLALLLPPRPPLAETCLHLILGTPRCSDRPQPEVSRSAPLRLESSTPFPPSILRSTPLVVLTPFYQAISLPHGVSPFAAKPHHRSQQGSVARCPWVTASTPSSSPPSGLCPLSRY
jgi:hypothetical protein